MTAAAAAEAHVKRRPSVKPSPIEEITDPAEVVRRALSGGTISRAHPQFLSLYPVHVARGARAFAPPGAGDGVATLYRRGANWYDLASLPAEPPADFVAALLELVFDQLGAEHLTLVSPAADAATHFPGAIITSVGLQDGKRLAFGELRRTDWLLHR